MKLCLALQATLLGFVAVSIVLESASIVGSFSTTAILTRRTNSRALVPTVPSFVKSLYVSAEDTSVATATEDNNGDEDAIDYEVPEDAVIVIQPKAMKRLRELRSKQKDPESFMVLRMGVRNGGCSGLSYVMDFSTEEDIQEDDEIDEYTVEKLKCVVDAKSMLYLYGLELDYSEELIGGGFKFFNPNAEESCGCGSSFGV